VTALGPRSAFLRTRPAKAFLVSRPKNRRTLRLELSERSSLTLTLARKARTRYVALRGAQTLTLAAGKRHLAWRGRWNGIALKAGAYRITVRPKDAAGQAGVARRITVRLR